MAKSGIFERISYENRPKPRLVALVGLVPMYHEIEIKPSADTIVRLAG